MIFRLTILFLLCFCFFSNAQKEDRNWVFGNNCGINFNDLNNVQTFTPSSFNFELSASISDSIGNLLLYLGNNFNDPDLDIRNVNHQVVEGGGNIRFEPSLSRSAFFLPINTNLYYLFYSNPTQICNTSFCIQLFYSIIDISYNNGQGKVISIDKPIIGNDLITEGISCVKHANGKDWWLIAHEKSSGSCTNRFFKILISGTEIEGPYYQDIGELYCIDTYPAGEVTVSKKGNKLSYTKWPEGVLEVFDFDRCTGILSNPIKVEHNSNINTYSASFSLNERFVYLSAGALTPSISQTWLYQYDLFNNSRILLWKDDSVQLTDFALGQLQIAPNNKIYLSYSQPNYSIPDFTYRNQYLFTINQPDSLGFNCDLSPFSFYLGDSSYASVGLPNMPNYNLGPISIYKADAGKNQTICLSQQEKGASLGDSAITGVEYQWFPTVGIDSPSIAMPYVVPDSSRWYYVTIIDTSIQNACQTRTDSVWVEFQSNLNAAFNYIIDDSLVTFESLSEEIIVNHTWHFGNGSIGQGSTTVNIYQYSEDSITVMHIVSSRCDADTAYATFLIKAPEVPVDTNDVVDTLSVMNYAPNTLRVYPNPTNNLLYVESPFIEQIEIFNLTGRQITSSSEPQVKVHNFPSGIYIYQVQMNNGTFVRGKFVKQ